MSSLQTLFIWDFDKTLVLDDTDLTAVQTLDARVVASHLHNVDLVDRQGWTQVMNKAFAVLVTSGHSPSEIVKAATSVRLPRETANAIRQIAATSHAENAIVSDSNSLFIHECLSRHALPHHLFTAGIHTNPAYVDHSRLLVTPYTVAHGIEHCCQRCPPNICKGDITDSIIENYSPRPTVVYIGDGYNDFCPVRRLSMEDTVLYRSGFSLERLINRHPTELRVQGISWESPKDLHRFILNKLSI